MPRELAPGPTRALLEQVRAQLGALSAHSGLSESIEAIHSSVKALESAVLEQQQHAQRQVQRLEHHLEQQRLSFEGQHLAWLERLAELAEVRDEAGAEHTRRVGNLAARVALELGQPPEWCEMLRFAGRMHDLGKLTVPESVLQKRSGLNPAERREVEAHTLRGAALLEGSTSAWVHLAASVARSHHERWDGSGYPHGLRGEAAPLEGRITAVADVFDALVRERPYKRPWTMQEALLEVCACAGSHFDPNVVGAFARVLEREWTASGWDLRSWESALEREVGRYLH